MHTQCSISAPTHFTPSVHTHGSIPEFHAHRGLWHPFPVPLPGFPGSPAGPGGPRVPGIPVRPCSPAESMKYGNGSPAEPFFFSGLLADRQEEAG